MLLELSHDHAEGDVLDDENEFELFARYDLGNFMEGAYVLSFSTEDMTDNIKLGLGMSFSVWNNVYLEL